MDVENWKLRIRAVTERFFDLAGFPSSPRNQVPYRLTNDVQRSLAHLAGFDGKHSRLLRLLETGVLRVSAEGASGTSFLQTSRGEMRVGLFDGDGLPYLCFPAGCLVVSRSVEVVPQTAGGDINESVLDEMDFGTVAARTVEISVAPGGTDAVIEIGSRTISGLGGVPLYALAKGSFVRVQWEWQYMYIVSSTGDAQLRVRWWNL